MDSEKRKSEAEIELERHDSAVPLDHFSIPKFMDKLKENLELPDEFLRACTLREGTWVIVVFLNCVAASLVGFLSWIHVDKDKETTKWWQEKFRNDFDYYYMDENEHIRNVLWPLWRPVSLAVIGTHVTYFVTGLMVIRALIKKNEAHPAWYIPWLVMTFMFCLVMWFISFSIAIYILVMIVYRPLSVTWDFGPLACCIVYSVGWTYSFFVVVAFYRRRQIVRYWKLKHKVLGSDVLAKMGLQLNKY